jgi:MarR family transcriptional regulator, organic hydroperoxide resistance regulator
MTMRSKRQYDPAATETPTERPTDAARAMDSLRRVVHALRIATRASERAFGLSAAQVFVLRQLSVTSGQSLSDLAARTRTTQSSVSEIVARLVQAGLVSRVPSSRDRRRAELSLTAAGEAVLVNAPETVQERLLRGFESLDERARQGLADGLESWLTASGLDDVAPTLFFEPSSGRHQ